MRKAFKAELQELAADLRELTRDHERWVWLAGGLCASMSALWLWWFLIPGLPGALAWVGTVSAWMVAMSMRAQQRRERSANRAVDLMLTVDVDGGVHVRVELDTAANELLADREPKATWYRASAWGRQIGRIEHNPDSAADRRWMAWIDNGVPSGTGHRTKTAACEALVRRFY